MSVWLLLAAGIVGFAAAWFAFEVKRAWSQPPPALPAPAPGGPQTVVPPADLGDLGRIVPELQAEIVELRRSIAWLQGELSSATPASPRPAPAPEARPAPPAPAPPPPPPAPAPPSGPARPAPEPVPSAIPGDRRIFDRADAPFRPRG